MKSTTEMSINRNIAKIVGSLFIIGTVAGVLSVVFTNPILGDPNYLTKISANENQIVIGAFFVLTMGLALAMVPVMLFPVLKKYNEALALGAVVFRGVLEAVAYIAIVMSWFLLLTVSYEYVKAEAPAASHFQTLGVLLLTAGDQIAAVLSIVFSLGTLMINYLFYQSQLTPRWLSIWGLIGAVLYLTSGLAALFSVNFDILMTPLALQEMILAIWLIIKGFNTQPLAPAPP